MVQIGRAESVDNLIARVGAKLDLTITSTSTPDRGQTVQWLNDGALLLARLLPPHRLGGLQFDLGFTDIGASANIDTDDILRVVSVRKYGVECTVMTKRDLSLAETRTPMLYTTRTPACAVTGEGGAVHLDFFPTFTGDVEIKAIKRPTAYEDSPSWVPDQWSIPVELETAMIDYAVIQGKVQDEEPEQAQMLMQHWAQATGLEIRTDAIGVD